MENAVERPINKQGHQLGKDTGEAVLVAASRRPCATKAAGLRTWDSGRSKSLLERQHASE